MIQRREFSISAASMAAVALGGATMLPTVAQAQARAFVDGTDYLTLGKPAPTDVPAGQIEVVEFFWYSCPHCNAFEPAFEAWAKKLPKDVTLRRIPVMFRPDFEPQQRLYYSLEAMGKLPELHTKVFNAIHVDKQELTTADQIATWVAKQGLDKTKFVEMFNSFSVTNKVRKATQLQDLYKVDGVPALGVAGKYYTSGELSQTMDRALLIVDFLVTKTRFGGK